VISVQWVLDITPDEKMDLELLTLRLLHILVAAVHTSSVTWLNAIYDLALHPEIHDELREEITHVFAGEDGHWTKQGLTKLMKMDSFIKESARFHPFQAGQWLLAGKD
jgi:cytochrome P450